MNAPTYFDFRNVNALWCSVLAGKRSHERGCAMR